MNQPSEDNQFAIDPVKLCVILEDAPSLRHPVTFLHGNDLWGDAGIIDKAFCIATPMQKAYWTMRFAARWRERGTANARDARCARGLGRLAGGLRSKVSGSARSACVTASNSQLKVVHRTCQTGRFLGYGMPSAG
jgi:hypothetical protein